MRALWPGGPRRRRLGLPWDREGQSRLCVQRRTPLREHPKDTGLTEGLLPKPHAARDGRPHLCVHPFRRGFSQACSRSTLDPDPGVQPHTRDGEPQWPACGMGRGPQAEAPRPPHRVRATEGSVPASLPAREEGTRGPQTPAHLEGAGAQLQPVLQELVHRGLDADALLLGQRSHREGADHHLLPHWNRPGAESEGVKGVTEPQGTRATGQPGQAGRGKQQPVSTDPPPLRREREGQRKSRSPRDLGGEGKRGWGGCRGPEAHPGGRWASP